MLLPIIERMRYWMKLIEEDIRLFLIKKIEKTKIRLLIFANFMK